MEYMPQPAVLELIGYALGFFAVCSFFPLVARLIFKLLKGVMP